MLIVAPGRQSVARIWYWRERRENLGGNFVDMKTLVSFEFDLSSLLGEILVRGKSREQQGLHFDNSIREQRTDFVVKEYIHL